MARRLSRVHVAHRRWMPRSELADDHPSANPPSSAAVAPHRAQVCSVSDT